GLVLCGSPCGFCGLDATARRGRTRGNGCAANRLLVEPRHLLDSACLSFPGMLPTFTGFSHGVNQSAEAKKASPALFPFVLLNFEAQAKCNQLHHRLTTAIGVTTRKCANCPAREPPITIRRHLNPELKIQTSICCI